MNLEHCLSLDVLTANAEQVLRDRIESATPVETLRTKDHKLLQVMQSQDGQKFVTRRYDQEGIALIQNDSRTWDMPFSDNWEMMQQGLSEAEISAVPSVLLENVR